MALVEILSGRSRSTDVLNGLLDRYPSKRLKDAALLHEIVMGVLRRRMALLKVVSGLVRRPLQDTDPLVRETLFCMAYQTVFLSRIPSHARVSASVDAARSLAGEGAARFVNAVGRALERETAHGDVLAGMPMSDLYSIPGLILARMREAIGREPTGDEFAATAGASSSTFRLNPAAATRDELIERLGAAGIDARATTFSPLGITVGSPGVSRSPDLVPRLLIPQDQASQLAVEILDPKPDERVIDLCAGTGVKTTQILGRAPGVSVLAVDRDQVKLEDCAQLCRDMGLGTPEVMVQDARRLPDSLKGKADAVLVDAPCTGIGTMVRRPEVRYLRSRKDFRTASKIQTGILDAALDLLAPGGRLVYAVCSFAVQEGPEIIDAALRGRNDVERVKINLGASSGSSSSPPFHTTQGAVLTLPWRDGMDGFYIAALRKIQ
ncbi:MAG: methyltransferase domain-containing protein [Deltaproteobacteria bacterium]|nr:methyltransferase domain-containing protein [Deltaproteobacteria bacterium]